MKKFIWFSAVFFLPFLLFADILETEVDSKTINLTIANLSDNINLTDFSGQQYLKINNSDYSYPKQNSNFVSDVIKVKIVLPDDNYSLKINSLNKTALNNFKLNFGSNFSENIKIEKFGVMRNNNIGYLIIQPFIYENGKLSIIDDIDLTITLETNAKTFSPSLFEEEFFGDVINKKHVNTSYQINNKKLSPVINHSSWYNPEKDYQKLTTKRDGLAKIFGKDLINLNQSLLNKDVKYLHLLYNGEEQYLYSLSNQIQINNDLILVFDGRRAEGDTTWLDNYTDEAAFYLFYDDSYEGLRYKQFPPVASTQTEIDDVKSFNHIEYDSVYFWGSFELQWDIENIHREKWLWTRLTNDGANRFDYFLNVISKDTLELSFNMQSVVFVKEYMTYQDFLVIFNNDTLQRFSIDTGSINILNLKIPPDKLLYGINKLSFLILNQYFDGQVLRPNDIGLDYIVTNSNVQPVAIDGNLNFTLEPLKDDSKILLRGYNSNKIIVIDKYNNLVNELPGKSSINLRSGIKSLNTPVFSFSTSDTSFFNTARGIHIVAFNNDKLNHKVFGDNSSAIEYLNSLSNNDYFVIGFNAFFQFNSNMKTKLTELGAKYFDNVIPGYSWILAGNKSNPNNSVEQFNQNGTANIELKDEINWGKNFAIEMDLLKSEKYNIISSDVESAETAKITKVNKTNLRKALQADAVIITHSNFFNAAKELSEYRTSQGLSNQLIDVEDIYKEFYYGKKSPHAIKEFLRFIYKNWEAPVTKFVALIGDANWDSRNLLKKSVNVDYVPTYGWPASDHWFVCLDSGKDDYHDMFIGRIPVSDSEQLSNYIKKLKDYDKAPTHPWMKMFLSLTGGDPKTGESENFKEDMISTVIYNWVNTEFSGDSTIIARESSAKEAEANQIIHAIDKGAIWVNFYGHGSPQVFDLDGWHADKLNNYGKYPFFTTISCNTAAFAEPEGISRDEDYMLIKDRGFIGAGGSTNLGLNLPGSVILSEMLRILTNTLPRQRTLGEILNNAKITILDDDVLSVAYAKQYVLLGDPMARIRVATGPELFIFKDETKVINQLGSSIITEKDSTINLHGWLYNNGYCERNGVELQIVHKYDDNSDTSFINYNEVCLKEYFNLTDIPIFDKAGIHQMEITIKTKDTSYLDHILTFEIFKDELIGLDPLPYWNVKKTDNSFRFINPRIQEGADYEFYISELNNNNESEITKSKSGEVTLKDNYIEWKPTVEFSENKNYLLYGRIIDSLDGEASQWLKIPFHSINNSIDTVHFKIDNDFLKSAKLENLIYDNEQKVVNFSIDKVPYSVVSARGNQEIGRFAEISYNNLVYVQTPDVSVAPVGINIVQVSGVDGKFLATRHFYTWDEEDVTAGLIRFLDDTVKKGDWIMLASCGSAWRMFYKTSKINPDTIGSFNSFKRTLAKFGAEVVWQIPDTNDIAWVTYMMIGRKETEGVKPVEKIDFSGYKLSHSDSLSFYPKDASIAFPAAIASKKWIELNLDDVAGSEVSKTISLIASNPNGQIGQVKTYSNINNISISDFSKNSSNMGAKIDYHRTNESDDINLKSLMIKYIPLPELAINNRTTMLLKDSLTRADTAKILFTVENISPRTDENMFDYSANIKLVSGAEMEFMDSVVHLQSDSSIIRELMFSTLKFDDVNKVNLHVKSRGMDIYELNNGIDDILYVLRDRIKPRVVVKSDGFIILDSFYVSTTPTFEITMFDNSYEPVTDNPFKVRINSRLQNESNTYDYQVTLINSDTLKAKLTFRPDTLVEEDNRLEVFFADAAGNRDTLEYHIFTSINAFIYTNKNYPNPFSETTDFSFYYVAPDNGGFAQIYIYDLSGRRIASLEQSVIVGENIISWNGFDDYGNTIPNGQYFYILQVVSQNFSKPLNGNMIKVK